MKKLEIKEKIDNGCKIVVALRPTQKHDKVTLKTHIVDPETDIHYPVYYMHCKDFLTDEQLRLIDLYNSMKNWQFRDFVDHNIAIKENPNDRYLVEKSVMIRAMKQVEYLELI